MINKARSSVRLAGAICASLLFGSLNAAGAPLPFETPKLAQPEAQAALERFQADYARITADPRFFEPPAQPVPWPVELSMEEQYRLFGLTMMLPEQIRKTEKYTRKMLREWGADPNATQKYLNIRMLPMALAAKDGKLDGPGEVYVDYDIANEQVTKTVVGEKVIETRITTSGKAKKRSVCLLTEGKAKPIASYLLIGIKVETHSSDPATEKVMTNVKQPPNPPMINIYYFDVPTFVNMTFQVMEQPDFKGGMVAGVFKTKKTLMTTLTTELGEDLYRNETYSGKRLQSISQQRNGKMDGEQITWMDDFTKGTTMRLDQMAGFEQARLVNVDGASMIEQHRFWKDGSLVKTAVAVK